MHVCVCVCTCVCVCVCIVLYFLTPDKRRKVCGKEKGRKKSNYVENLRHIYKKGRGNCSIESLNMKRNHRCKAFSIAWWSWKRETASWDFYVYTLKFFYRFGYKFIFFPVVKSIYFIYIYIYIYSPTTVGLSSLANEVIALLLAFIASLFIYELRSR